MAAVEVPDVRLTWRDHVAFRLRVQRVASYVLVAVGALDLALFVVDFAVNGLSFSALYWSVFLVLILAYYFVVGPIMTAHAQAREPISTIRVDDEGATWSNERGMLRYPWRDIQRVLETRSHIFLMLGRKRGIILPKRMLAPPQEARVRELAAAHAAKSFTRA